MVAGVRIRPVSMALYPPTVWRKTDTTNDRPSSTSHWTFWVTRPRLATRFWNIRGESSGSLPARSIERMCQKNQARSSAPIRTNSQTGEIEPAGITTMSPIAKSWLARNQPYVPACRMPTTTKNRPAAEIAAPSRSNVGFAPRRPGSTMRRPRTRIAPTTTAWTHERQAPAGRRGDQATDQGTRRGADARRRR